jgi:carboxymethylenebutenolidase
MVRLKAADGHELDAYVAEPNGKAKGGIVVVQEIFGVTGHIQRVADQYAAAGYRAIAPAMFDRIRRGITLDYKDVQQGIAYMLELKWPNTLADVGAAAKELRSAGRVAIVGYCWGGTVAHVAAADLTFDAAISYYGGGVAKMLDKKPRCPILYHFGDQDHSIPMPDVEKIRAAYPGSEFYVYPGAQHGFNCDERGSYSAPDAKLALTRSIEFLGKYLG